MCASAQLSDLEQSWIHRESGHQRLPATIDSGPYQPLDGGQRPVQLPLDTADLSFTARNDPGWGALEQREGRDFGSNLRYELDCRRAGTDYRYAPVSQVVVAVPARRMEHRTLERFQPRNAGDVRL